MTDFRRKTKIEPPMLLVTKTRWGNRDEKEEEIKVPKFEGETARVSYLGSSTIKVNDSDYVKVEVRVELPCYPVSSEIDRALDFSKEIVEKRIMEEMESLA